MSDYAAIVIGAVLVNNLALAQFLGLCPILSLSRGLHAAMILALTTALLIVVCAAANHLIDRYLLQPRDLEYLRTMAFMVVIAAVVPLIRRVLAGAGPTVHAEFSGLVPLAALNSAALGVPLLNAQAARGPIESALYGISGALGISLALILFAGLRERIAVVEVPEPFRGTAVGLITIGLMSMAFMGFTGLTKS